MLVLVHSFSGHTAAAGHEIAEMLGGAFVRIPEPPGIPDVTPLSGPRLEDILPRVDMHGVRELFLGFPIYDERPSPVADEIVRTLDLHGVRVIPLFTYMHYFDPRSIGRLAAAIEDHGGRPSPAIALRLPVMMAKDDIVARARMALLERRDLWAGKAGPVPQRSCVEMPAPHAARLCSVPAGQVWLGDVSPHGFTPRSNPPRLHRIDAFDLDEKEISIAQFSRCVAAKRCRERKPRSVLARGESKMNLPQADLSWSDALDYCAFAGLRLPTEAEWVRAARGSSLNPYPWGQASPGHGPSFANLGEKPSRGLAHYALAAEDSAWEGDGAAGLSVGCQFDLGRGPFGHCDLVGNLLEWVDGPLPTAKGGSWIDVEPRYVTVSARVSTEQRHLGSYLNGARCARSR